ncbi:hypothetical protein AALO_G00157430 [Alosa alosa]|uniref:1-aminocyclopropane-1-carboxylate synthase-like protein 1 n=1 Tax=Alosa alosa TaxID=278164 RepID=A0AAV6GM86_9TELE|nr:1-aminocyclopropane-1-carboxylate synthase-like protein 1 [Alosa alosa]KAG5273941.1 hypothetical protein AALO_G00157430 [Alosa alosa]
MDFRGKKYERGSNWSDPEVAELLQLWSDESVQIELESCLRNQHVFNRIAEVLHGKGIFRTGDQCREKIKKMKLEYRRIKENQKRTIRGGRTWKFYEVMDRVLTNRPSLSYSSGGGGGIMAHQLLPAAGYSADTYLHGLPTAAFGSSTSASYLFSHPPKPGDLLEIKSEDVNSEDGLLSSGGPAELLYHIGSGDEPDADSKSLGADIEDPGEAGRAEGATDARLSPSGMSDQNMAGSSGTGMSVRDGGGGGEDRPRSHDQGGQKGPSFARQRKRRCVGRGTCGGGGSRRAVDKALLSFLTWQREAEERLLSLEEARLEREAQAEERRQRLDERRAEQERQHELRLLSLFAGALTGVAGGRTEGRSTTVATPSQASTPPPLERLSTPAAPVSSTPASCSVRGPDAPGHSIFLSRRGNRIRQHQGILQEGFTQYHADKYSQENPNGIINMGTSENKLCYDLLHQRLSQPDMIRLGPSLLQYPDWKGHPFIRGEVARFLTQYCRSVNPLKPENVVVMNGCGSLFSAIAAVLCDPEDAILIPTPFYGCITEDVHLYSSVRLVHAHLSAQPSGRANRPFHLSVDILESALLKAKKEGVNVRGVILVNPHNPLGEMYSSEEMTDFLEFAKRHELHVIVDEVYMLTVFDEAVTFHSVLSLDRLPDPQRTHVLWGLSKDFAMAGIRVGTLYSQNRDLVEALDQLGCFHGVPGPVQHQVARLLQDKGWISDEFLPTCRKRLRAAHGFLAEELRKMDVPYLHRPVGFFIWADFSKFLSEASFPAELELWRRFLRHRVVLSCGQAFSCSSPGWFRIVFSDEESRLQLGMQRIRQALEGLKELHSPNNLGEAKQETSMKNEKDAKDSSTTREASGPTAAVEPSSATTTDTLSLDGEELVVLDCQTSQSGVKLDSLIGELRQQIRSSDWLEKNTPELTAREDPELFEVFKDLLDRARK